MKFRLYLKRLSGVAQQQGGIPNSFCGPGGPGEPNVKLGSSLGRFDIQALVASGKIPPQTLAALHAELFGRPTGSLMLPTMDQPALLQASLQGPKCIPVEHGITFGRPLMKSQPNLSKHFPQSIVTVEDVPSGFGAWPTNSLGSVGPSGNLGVLGAQNSTMLVDMLQQQQQQQQQQQSLLSESNCSINVQPSCLVVPSRSPANFQAGNSPASVNQNCSFSRSAVIDYNPFPSQSNNSSLGIGQAPDGDLKTTGVLSGYSGPGSIFSSVSSCSVHADNSTSLQARNSTITLSAARQVPGLVPNISNIQGFHGTKSGEVLDQGPLKNLGFVGKGTCIPSRFAVDELESPTSNLNHGKICGENNGNRVKQEPNLDFMENAKVGIPILQHFSPNDLMSVFSE